MLPMNGRMVALSTPVLEQFRNHDEFRRGHAQTVGALFGRIDSDEMVSVHYAPPLVDKVPLYGGVNAYAFGRTRASHEAAWHLRGWIDLGYWIAHDWPQPDPQRLMRVLEVELNKNETPRILVTLFRTPSGFTEIRAHTCVSMTVQKIWRRLELTDLVGAPVAKLHEGQLTSGEGDTRAPFDTKG